MRFKRRSLILGSVLLLPGVVGAQASADPANTPQVPAIGGSITMDLVTVRSATPGLPLRFGKVIAGSESVEFEGKKLERGKDYQIDNEAGVVYLMRMAKIGSIVRVSYRYDKATQAAVTGTMNLRGTLPTFKFDLAQGVKAHLGLGLAERQADGNVLLSNIYGMSTDTGPLKGLFLMGDRSKSDTRSGFEYRSDPGATPTGRSKFIVQNLKQNFAGGAIEANYQDISHNFAGFSAVSGAGYDQGTVDQMAKERGLKRFAMGLRDVQMGGAKVSSNFREVRDGGASIDWKQFAFQSGAFQFNFNSQKVDSDFRRFNDLAEQDRGQLAREAGLLRENLSFGFAPKLGAMSFSQSKIEDQYGNGIYRQSVGLQTKAFGLNYSEQLIDADFRSFGNLWEPERGQWGKEAGIKRIALGLDAALSGGKLEPILRHSEMASSTGRFHSDDVTLKAGTWSLEHSARGSDPTFDRMGAMSETEMDSNIQAIAKMYGPNTPSNPQERPAFLGGTGIDRKYTQLKGQPFKNWNLEISRFRLDGQKDDAGFDKLSLNNDKFSLEMRKQLVGEQFEEIGRLMRFERERLGSIVGLMRSDVDLTLRLSPGRTANYSQMTAETPDGSANRSHLEYTDPKIEVKANARSVDQGFGNVNQLVDPEKDLLNALRGFDERDASLKWKLNPKLSLDAFSYSSYAALSQEQQSLNRVHLNWKPSGKTEIDLFHQDNQQSDPLQTLFSNNVDRISLFQDLGRIGKLQYLKEDITFDGLRTQAPDSHRQFVAFETKLNDKTAVRTEQTRTQFENGQTENISANTLSTELDKRGGVSVSDIHVNRDGTDRDERRRNYGFWLNLGRGLRFNYGYVRQMNGAAGTLNSNVNITPGTLDFLRIDSAGYTENRWDGLRTQAMTNVSFGSARPIDLLFLKGLQFNYSMDTATDQTAWVRENKMAGISGRLGSNQFAVAYKSQMHGSGFRGIDRSFSFQTDPNPKNWFVGHVNYTARQLPEDDQVMMRDIGFTLRPAKGIELSNQMITNPEDPQPRPDLPMFRMVNPWRTNKWNLKWDQNPGTSLSASWEERINDRTLEAMRLGGITLDLFKDKGSPLQLFYGVEQRWGNVERSTAHRYWVRYDQKTGPNQMFSLFVGNLSYQGKILTPKKDNWTLNVNYQLRF